MSVGLKAKLCKFSSVYLLFVFQDLLSVPACLHRYLQKETIHLAQAVTYKNAVTDSLKEKRSDGTAADLHARAMALCETNQIALPSPVQRRKTKQMLQHLLLNRLVGRAVMLVVPQTRKTLNRHYYFLVWTEWWLNMRSNFLMSMKNC